MDTDLIGTMVGNLTVISGKISQNGRSKYLVRCQCGTEKYVAAYYIKNGKISSCGCKKIADFTKRVTKHGLSKAPEYQIWHAMKRRCLDPKNPAYADYGGRGIQVCDRWLQFENFYADMGPKPEGLSLERIDNNLGYSKLNCKWATHKEQMSNTRKCKYVTYLGRTQTLMGWSIEAGINYVTLKCRYKRSKDPIRLFRPVDGKYRPSNHKTPPCL